MKAPGCFFLLLLFYFPASAQVNEQFNDSNFMAQPAWFGNQDSWIVNADGQLQSNDTTPKNSFYISTANHLAMGTQWEFSIRLHFNTSSTNYTDVYLIASDSSFTNVNTTGYFVRIGNTADEVSLYRKDSNGLISKIIDGRDDVSNSSNNYLKIKVIRNVAQQFILFTDATGTGTNYVNEGMVKDTAYTQTAWFGFLVKQSTGSFFKKHFFDDITVQPYSPDTTRPFVQSVKATGANAVTVLFSEPVDTGNCEAVTNYRIGNFGCPAVAKRDSLNNAIVYLNFNHSFPDSQTNSLSIKGVKDVSGNVLTDTIFSFTYYTIQPKDLVINEILFDPKPNSSDYVELYNNSTHAIDVSDLYITNRSSSGNIGALKKLSDTSFFISPKSYAVITENNDDLLRNYFVKDAAAIISIPSMPSYPNTEGTVVITTKEERIIDEVHYSADWHQVLIRDAEGVSLERISPEKNSAERNNWHSAAATAGYGTPGYQNSQTSYLTSTNTAIEITPAIFSPDNDGYNDKATIQYKAAQNGYMANLTIFDANGKQVRYLVKNELLGLQGSWNWDGLNEGGQKLPIGTYIIYTELFTLQGKRERFKNTVVLARKLN